MRRKIAVLVWFPVVALAAFAVGYLAWAKATFNWPYDNVTTEVPKTQVKNGIQTYKSDYWGIEISYQQDFSANSKPVDERDSFVDGFIPYLEESGEIMQVVIKLKDPKKVYPGTDLDNAFVGLKVDETSKTAGECGKKQSARDLGSENINGITFMKIAFDEVATGHQSETIRYSTFHNNVCYVLEEVINTSGFGAVDGLKEVAYPAVLRQLYEVTKTFQFINLGFLVKVTNTGGLCADGPCRDEYVIRNDWSYEAPGVNTQLTEQEFVSLKFQVENADYQALTRLKFAGTCPAAYDGPQYIFEFYTPRGERVIDSCEIDIEQPSQPFSLLSDIISKYSKFEFRIYR